MYDADVKRLDPYNQQLGIDNLTAVNAAATNNPEARNMFAGQTDVTATTDIAGPTAGTVAVNQNSPYDVNDPGLKYLMDVGTRAITDQQVGKGKYHSGGTMERLQELGQGAALNRGQQIQSIETQRDTNALNADNQAYKQDLGSSMFDLEQGRGNIANQVGINDQRFGQNLQANNFDQGADLNEYNQLAGLVGIGQNSAAQQGANTGTIADTLGQMSTNQGYADFWKNQKQGNNLSNLFGQMFGSGVGSAAGFFQQQQGVKSPREWNRIRRIQEMAEQAQAAQTQGQTLQNQVRQQQLEQMKNPTPQTKTVMQNGQMWEYDVGQNGAMVQGSERLAGQGQQQQRPQQPQSTSPLSDALFGQSRGLNGQGPLRQAAPSVTPQRGFNEAPPRQRSPSYTQAADEGLTPGSPEFLRRVAELNDPRPTVSISNKAQTEEEKGLAGLRVAEVQRISEAAYNAQDTLRSINQMDAIDVQRCPMWRGRRVLMPFHLEWLTPY